MWNRQSNHFNRSIITQPMLLLIVMTGSVSAQRTAVEALMLRYLTSILRLYPGDVIVTGTPDGDRAARKPPEFLKPGDEVTIEIEGIGALKTPMRAATRANQ